MEEKIVSQGILDADRLGREKAKLFGTFLNRLVDARNYAADLNLSAWEFALDLDDAQTVGVCANDLRWMLGRSWIEMRPDLPGEDKLVLPMVSRGSRFIITQMGIQFLLCEREQTSSHCCSNDIKQPIKPRWDADRNELFLGFAVVKRFRVPATNQQMVLSAFEEDGWPSRIDDPLPQDGQLAPKRRLSDTIKCLNRNQLVQLIRFRGDGSGEGVLWDSVADSDSTTG